MANSDKNIRITGNKNTATGIYPKIVFTGASAGTSVLTLEVRDDNTVAFTGSDGDVFALDYNLSTGTIWSVNDKSGTPFLRASASGIIGIAELGSGVLTGIGQTNPKYKLDVQGWAGFASTGDGSYTVLVENGLASGNNALSIRAANALRFYNTGNTLYTGFIGAQSGVNTTYTLPTTSPATGTSVLQSTPAGVLSWVPMTAGSSSGTVNSGTAGSVAVYTANGTAVSGTNLITYAGSGVTIGGAINATSTSAASLVVLGGLGVTANAFIGGTTSIQSSQVSISPASGALVVTGGVGIGGSLFTSTTVPSSVSGVALNNGFVTSGTWAGTVITALYGGTGFNSYSVGDLLIASTGTSLAKISASSNSGYVLTSNGANTLPTWQAVPASSATSVAASGTTVNQSFFITTVNAASGSGFGLSTIQSFVVNGLTGLVTMSGLAVTNLTNSASTTTGALTVTGGLGITGNAFIGGTANITNTQVSINTASGALVVAGGVGIGGSLYTSTGSSSSVSGVILANGNVSATTYNKLTLTTPPTAATLTLANNSTLATSGAFSLTLTTTGPTNVTFPTGGTLTTTSNNLGVFASTTSSQLIGIISDATGTAGKLVFSTSPTFTTSVITDSATLAVFNTVATTVNAFGAASTLSVGAATGSFTHNSTDNSATSSTGSLIVLGGAGIAKSVSIGGRLQMFNGANYSAFVSSATGNTVYTLPATSPATGSSVLQSTSTGVMSWVPMTSGGSATPAGTNNGDIQYKFGSAFQASVNFNYDDSVSQLYVKNFPSTSPSGVNAALQLLGSTNTWNGSTSGTFVAINAATGFAGDLINAQVNGVEKFRVSGAGAVKFNNAFTFPTTDGSANQVLQTNGSGTVSWATVSSSGAGSGTVAIPGAQYQIAGYYTGTGASVTGSATLTNNTSTGVVNITHTTPSSSTSTGALVVAGSVGAGGSLFVGGQINQTYTPVINAATDHALFMQSNPVPTTVGSLIQIGLSTKWDGTTAGYFTGSSNGTYIGINAASGNTADFLNFQQNGVPVFVVGAGGTNIQVGGKINYATTDVIASFASSSNNYNQLILQNLSKSTSASADFVISNDISTDTTFYGNFGMNSSTFTGTGALSAANAVYLTSTSGPLVLGSTTQHPIRFVVNGGTSDILYIDGAGTAISVFTNFDMSTANDLRFWNTGNTLYGAIQGGNYTGTSYLLTMPTATVGAGFSVMMADLTGQMYFVQPGSGIAFSSATANTPIIRAKRALNLQFCTSFTPAAAGPDTAILRVPESASDGTSLLTYNLRRFQVRVETPSSGSSRIQLEKSSTDTGAFTLAGAGSSFIGGTGATIAGAGIYLTSTTFASGTYVTSGNLLRLDWTLLNATHANFSVNLILEEV
jgi:hypothetical protein